MKIKNIGIIASTAMLCVSLNLAIAEEGKSTAKPSVKKSKRATDRPSRESLIKRFDKDGDGKLSEAERSEARKALGSRSGRSNPQADKINKNNEELVMMQLQRIFVNKLRLGKSPKNKHVSVWGN